MRLPIRVVRECSHGPRKRTTSPEASQKFFPGWGGADCDKKMHQKGLGLVSSAFGAKRFWARVIGFRV